MTLGEKIKSLRTNNGMSQEILAKELKINRNHLSRIETGISEPTASILKRLALLFNISIDSLLDIKINTLKPEDKMKKITSKCKSLQEDDLDFVLRILSIMKNEYVKNLKNGKYK